VNSVEGDPMFLTDGADRQTDRQKSNNV